MLIVHKDAAENDLVSELVRDVQAATISLCDTADKALDLVNRTTFQLVIADCGDSGIDGLAILERVKRVSPTTSVILASALATVDEAVRAIRSGAEEYFKKPFNPEHFKLAVRRCLDRRALYSGDQGVTGLMMLLNACQLISGFLEEEKILETTAGYLRRETNCKAMGLFRLYDGRRTRVPTSSDIDPDVVEVLTEGQNFIQGCRDEKSPMKVVPKSGATPEIAIFQFKSVNETEYFFVCLNPTWATPPEEVVSRYRVLQAQIQMAARNIQNYRGVRHLLYLDEPTGLGNTRYLHHVLDQSFDKWEKAGRKGTFSVLFIDVDKFKGINDTHGHLVGTKLLHEMGQIIKQNLRKTDVAFRYGGDEFVVLLDGASSAVACAIAERIRSQVEGTQLLAREGHDIRLTLSIGVANCPEHAVSKKDIIDAADNAMYAVKRSSRNRVYLAEKKKAA